MARWPFPEVELCREQIPTGTFDKASDDLLPPGATDAKQPDAAPPRRVGTAHRGRTYRADSDEKAPRLSWVSGSSDKSGTMRGWGRNVSAMGDRGSGGV